VKALIFPFQRAQALAPLRSLCPDFLLPLAGKPMVEHIVEQLVTAGVRDVTLLCDDRPEEVARHFGNGERWGCTLSISAVREQGGLQRMVRAALHGGEGMVICLPGNLTVTEDLTSFLSDKVAERVGMVLRGTLLVVNAASMRTMLEEIHFESFEELTSAAEQMGVLPAGETAISGVHIITEMTGFLLAQRNVLDGQLSGSRIPARLASQGVWIGDHTKIAVGIRLVAPVMIGSHSQISGSGQIGPNAVISPYCLVNNSDLICDSLVMSGTATGPHTELNGVVARGSVLVNLRNGATINSPDAFILGDVGDNKGQSSGDSGSILIASFLLLLLLPLGLPLLILSIVAPSLIRQERYLGNRRMKTLAGDNPRVPFTLRQFCIGPLLLRRWPGIFTVLAGDLKIIGASATPAEAPDQCESDSVFGLDAARGLFHIWEVEGELPESADERIARENFHAVTRTFAGDLKIIIVAGLTVPSR